MRRPLLVRCGFLMIVSRREWTRMNGPLASVGYECTGPSPLRFTAGLPSPERAETNWQGGRFTELNGVVAEAPSIARMLQLPLRLPSDASYPYRDRRRECAPRRSFESVGSGQSWYLRVGTAVGWMSVLVSFVLLYGNTTRGVCGPMGGIGEAIESGGPIHRSTFRRVPSKSAASARFQSR